MSQTRFFFPSDKKKIVDNNTASLFRVLFLELLSLVIGESVRERERERERESKIFLAFERRRGQIGERRVGFYAPTL
mgnify:CR=1 FL=1